MKIALLGTGLMGFPLAERILKAGHPLTVYNRTAAKAKPLVKKGARLANSPLDAVRTADVVLLVLAAAPAIRKLLFNPAILKHLKGKSVLQMGTIGPGESRAIAAIIHKNGGQYMECPVLGSIAEVKSGQLILMFGGSRAQFNSRRKFLKCLGKDPLYIGPVGRAAALKLCLNQLIASHIVGFSQSLALIRKSGVDVEQFMGILKQSTLFAPMFEKKLPRMLSRQYSNPNFSTRNMLKDIRLFLKASEGFGFDLRTLKSGGKVLERAIARGFDRADYCSVYETISGKRGA